MVLQENADDEILVAGENAISGCPYAVVALGENLVGTAINSQVRHPTFLQPNTLPRVLKTKTFCKQVAVWSVSPEGELTSSATWSGAFIAYMLARGPSPRTLIVGDALRSVTLLEYVPPASAPMQGQLKELGKDYRARYMVAVEALSSSRGTAAEGGGAEGEGGGGGGLQRIIGAEADLNMFTLERGRAGWSEGFGRRGRPVGAGSMARGRSGLALPTWYVRISFLPSSCSSIN